MADEPAFPIEIETRAGHWTCPEAFRTGVEGLVVHRVIVEGEDGKPKLGSRWVVTHEGSGQTVMPGSLESKEDAIGFARKIADLAPWSIRKDMLEMVPGLLDRIYRAAEDTAPIHNARMETDE